ncbi:CbrC family protein [Kribbella sp. NPDC023972]|uniref:CbrC family protein n=1 Tax=Kribbella sp. NPDC023972 TaxID=3154795 RepID=UPI0033CB3105
MGSVFGRQADEVYFGCIASGTAAERLGTPHGPAEFTDIGWGMPDNVPAAVLDEIAHRTPGYVAWQEPH